MWKFGEVVAPHLATPMFINIEFMAYEIIGFYFENFCAYVFAGSSVNGSS